MKIDDREYELTDGVLEALTNNQTALAGLSDTDIMIFAGILRSIGYSFTGNRDTRSPRGQYIRNNLQTRVNSIRFPQNSILETDSSVDLEELCNYNVGMCIQLQVKCDLFLAQIVLHT